jgi:two-component system chemotaxis response regulator CheB
MPPLFTKTLADSLSRQCKLAVREAQDGELLLADSIYIAPGGMQM